MTTSAPEPYSGLVPNCNRPPAGWTCSRVPGHEGPCAAWPVNTPPAPSPKPPVNYLRVTLRADVNGWDIDEVEAHSHRELFLAYAANLRADSDRHQADADRLRALAEYAERLAQLEEP